MNGKLNASMILDLMLKMLGNLPCLVVDLKELFVSKKDRETVKEIIHKTSAGDFKVSVKFTNKNFKEDKVYKIMVFITDLD